MGISALGCGDSYLTPTLRVIDEAGLTEHIQVLASDELEGRGPSSPGETLTVQYLSDAFEQMGLQPGNDGSYFQDVPLVESVVSKYLTAY